MATTKKPSPEAVDRAVRMMIAETLVKTGQVVGTDGSFLDKDATGDPRHPAHRPPPRGRRPRRP